MASLKARAEVPGPQVTAMVFPLPAAVAWQKASPWSIAGDVGWRTNAPASVVPFAAAVRSAICGSAWRLPVLSAV